MPSIKDDSTVNRIAEVFCGEGKRNKAETLRIVGYKDSYCDNHGTGIVYTNDRVLAAIQRIDSATQAVSVYNTTESMKRKENLLNFARSRVEKGDMDAIRTSHVILKQMDNITGLEQQHIHDHAEQPAPMTEERRQALIEALKIVEARPKLHTG